MLTRKEALARLEQIRAAEAALQQQRQELLHAADLATRDLAVTSGNRQECEFWLTQLPEEHELCVIGQ